MGDSVLQGDQNSFEIDKDFEFEAPKFTDFLADASEPPPQSTWFEAKHKELEPETPYVYDPLWTESSVPKPKPVLNLGKLSISLGKILKAESGVLLSPDGKKAKLGAPSRIQSPKPNKTLLRTVLDPNTRPPSPLPISPTNSVSQSILSPRDESPKRNLPVSRKLTKAVSSPCLAPLNNRKSATRVEARGAANPIQRTPSLKKPMQLKNIESTVRTRILNKPPVPLRSEAPSSPRTTRPASTKSTVTNLRRKTEGPFDPSGERSQRNRRSEGEILHTENSKLSQRKLEKEQDEFLALLEQHNKKVKAPEKPAASSAEQRTERDDKAFFDLLAQHNKKVQPAPQYEPRKYPAKDIKLWEQQSGLLWATSTPSQRVQCNEWIAQRKESGQL